MVLHDVVPYRGRYALESYMSFITYWVFYFRLSLHELLAELEEDEPDRAEVYMIPPDDGVETDQDSDKSDEEHEADPNHFGPSMLRTECEAILYRRNPPEYDSEDDIPLSSLVPKKRKNEKPRNTEKIQKQRAWKFEEPSFAINTECHPEQPPADLINLNSPLKFFQLFFDGNLCEVILAQSNIYASQKNVNMNLRLEELYVFFGALLLSGYAKYPNKRMYWSSESDVPKILADSMRLNRFEQIVRNLHLNDNSNIDKEDRLYKLRPIIETLNVNFRKYSGLDEKLSIDESMIPYYGKHYAKQFIKGKPIRFGFKNWALCTSNGYLLAFDIYMGKQPTLDNENKTFGIGGNVVLSLLEKANIPPHKGYQIYFDNYFTSLKLLTHLSQKGFCATGTLRENRVEKCPLKSKQEWNKAERGSSHCVSSEDVVVVQWKDNKVVSAATNFDTSANKSASRYCRETKSKINIPQPGIIYNYNRGMGGVDKLDNMVANYRTRIRQKKWWWPIFVYLFDVSVVNAWLLMRIIHPDNPICSSLLSFRRNLALAFLHSYGVKSNKGKMPPTLPIDSRFDKLNHLVDYSETDRRCAFCTKKSNFICIKCAVGLHPKRCFTAYHTK